ncbi:hypothetical protein Pint_13266 [Pistacia integerrima]|uniref:Uncharacterized protein n=1 Tax=Pistacia integerrima TaxID=434235 RepID=A0ACC0Y9Z8_9ROSI|nr:hypothetical protein Pint_13266 [Pistacia integerrima]
MATPSSASNIILNYPIDQIFDLDEALTMTAANTWSPEELSKDSSHRITEPNTSLTSKLQTVSTAGVCAVCMESFGSEFPGKQVICGHVFHDICIAMWVSNCNSCPLCRSICIISGQD